MRSFIDVNCCGGSSETFCDTRPASLFLLSAEAAAQQQKMRPAARRNGLRDLFLDALFVWLDDATFMRATIISEYFDCMLVTDNCSLRQRGF